MFKLYYIKYKKLIFTSCRSFVTINLMLYTKPFFVISFSLDSSKLNNFVKVLLKNITILFTSTKKSASFLLLYQQQVLTLHCTKNSKAYPQYVPEKKCPINYYFEQFFKCTNVQIS